MCPILATASQYMSIWNVWQRMAELITAASPPESIDWAQWSYWP